jgi:hypothetical protein
MERSQSVISTLTVVAAIAVTSQGMAQAILEPAPVYTSPTYIEVPPPQQEVITEAPAPTPTSVWVPGQWERTADSWSWNAGEWVQPPFSNAYWVPGYWQHNDGQYLWETGHWAAAEQGVVVQKPVTIPPVYVEPQPAAPATTGYVWQPGYWQWRGTWVWVPGEYVQTVTPGAVWVQGEWEAINGTWRWNPAHWAAA